MLLAYAQKAPFLSCALLGYVLSGLFSPAPTFAEAARKCAGVSLASAIEVHGKELTLNGIGKRTVTAFRAKVYVAGLYVPKESSDAVDLLRVKPKRLVLHFVRDVSSKEMAEALDEGVRNNTPKAQLADARAKIELVTAKLPALEKGLRLVFTERADGSLEIHAKDKLVATLNAEGLAALLFRVWLGERPPDARLRKALLGMGDC